MSESDAAGAAHDELPTLRVGDHVADREDPEGATLLVVGIKAIHAADYPVGDATVADYNAEYPADDHVVQVIYPKRGAAALDLTDRQSYAFPRSRLRRERAIHGRDRATGGDSSDSDTSTETEPDAEVAWWSPSGSVSAGPRSSAPISRRSAWSASAAPTSGPPGGPCWVGRSPSPRSPSWSPRR